MWKLLISIWLLFAAIVVRADSVVLVGFGAAGGTCAETMSNTGTTTSTRYDVYNDAPVKAFGQAITGNGEVLCNVIFGIDEWAGTPNLKVRISTSSDLTSGYIAEVTPDTSEPVAQGWGEITADFESSAITLTSSTTYYILVANLADSYANRVAFGYGTTDDYAGGAMQWAESTQWVCVGKTGDAYFKVQTK